MYRCPRSKILGMTIGSRLGQGTKLMKSTEVIHTIELEPQDRIRFLETQSRPRHQVD